MIFSRMRTGLSLLILSVRYLIGNPVLLLLPVSMLFLMAGTIRPLLIGRFIPLNSFELTSHAYSPSVLLLYALGLYSSFFVYVYAIRQTMRTLSIYQPSFAPGRVMRMRVLIPLVLLASLIGIMAIPIVVLQGTARILVVGAATLFYFFVWPIVPIVLQAQCLLSKIIPRAACIMRRTWLEALCGTVIFHVMGWITFYLETDGVIGVIIAYIGGLNIVLQGVFAGILYRYSMDDNCIIITSGEGNVDYTKKAYCILRNKQKWDIGPGHPMYCCQEWIDDWINDDTVPVSYRPEMRYYYLISDSRSGGTQILASCFVCKHVFPEDLGNQWIEIQEKEYDINEPYFSDNNPQEFKSEEWWRKRGL